MWSMIYSKIKTFQFLLFVNSHDLKTSVQIITNSLKTVQVKLWGKQES